MFNFDPTPPKTVTLFADGLLSKWGFSDGDLLNWLYEYQISDPHRVLCEIVRQKLLPSLDQTVEVQEIRTIHNPIRALTVDGVDVSKLWYESARGKGMLSPASIEVTGEEVLEIARSLLLRTPSSGTATTQHPKTMHAKKSSSKPKRPAKQKTSGGCPGATCSRFWVILLETPGEHMDSKSAIGPFKSHAAAEKWIIDDARGTYADSSPDLRAYNAEEWGEPCAIVQERRRIRPVPTATIKVRLVQLSSENVKNAGDPPTRTSTEASQ